MNLPKEFEFEVTAADIRKGIRHAECFCPMALALYRHLGRSPSADYGVSVDAHRLLIEGEAYHARGQKTFVHNFDNGKPVQPRKFKAVRVR